MISRVIRIACVALACSAAAAAQAQTTTTPRRIAGACGFVHPDAVSELTEAYTHGVWTDFHQRAIAIVAEIGRACAPALIDLKRDAVELLWVADDPLGGSHAVYHAVVQADPGEPYASTFPGLGAGAGRAFEIFVADNRRDAVASSYKSTRDKDPLAQQVPSVVEAAVDPLAALLDATTRSMRASKPSPPAEGTAYATVSEIMLPARRATLGVSVRVALAPTADDIAKQAMHLRDSLVFSEAAHSACARTLAESLAAVIADKAAACEANPGGCASAVQDAFAKAYDADVAQCRNAHESEAAAAVDKAFRKLVANLDVTTIPASFDVKNAPRTLASFGVMTAFAVTSSVFHATRATLDSGSLVADPLGHQFALVVVNVGFRRYDADAFSPSTAERFRWFAGAVVTPEFGMAAGVSAAIVRGLTANAGVALLGVKGLAAGETLGRPPKNADAPFTLAAAGAVFVGVGYNFK